MRAVSLMILCLCLPCGVFAEGFGPEDKTLRFDRPQDRLRAPSFKRDSELRPNENDFSIIEASFMSNNIGERWAMTTLRNTSTGQRLLRKENIVATFADGSQSYAREGEETFKGLETITVPIYFGVHPFPIIQVEVD